MNDASRASTIGRYGSPLEKLLDCGTIQNGGWLSTMLLPEGSKIGPGTLLTIKTICTVQQKTIYMWIAQCRKSWGNQARHNTAKYSVIGVNPKEDPAMSLKGALFRAFVWNKTPEGFQYWKDIYNSL